MNQTEILKLRAGAENKSIQNINSTHYSNQNSSITIIKANTYQLNRDKTPKAQISTKSNTSSNKLIRVNSSKGINVSLRPTSSQKQVKQFNSTNNISIIGQSQTTIKLDDVQIMQQMREQLKKMNQKYEDKMNQQISYQHNFLTVQINRLKQLLVQNQSKLAKQQFQLVQLINRVQNVQKKIQAKTNLMAKQLGQFKRFYDQCYHYTIKRVSQAQTNMKILTNYINQTTSTKQNIQTWKYIQYANNLVKKIITNCSVHSSSLKYYLNQQLYQLQIKISQFHDKYQQLDNIVHQMKIVKFSNQSLKQYIKQLGKFGINTNNIRKDFHKENFLEYYQPKFKQIIKRVNNSVIEIDLVKNIIQLQLQNRNDKTTNNQQQIQIQQLNLRVQNLQKKLEQQKLYYTKQLQIKQEVLSKSNPRILELQTKLHACYQHQGRMMKQISELKLKVSYYQTKCQKNSQRQYGIQSTLAQAYSETLVKQKTKKFVQQKQILQNKIKDLESQIKQLDNQNYLLAEKLSKSMESIKQNSKLQTQLKFATKLIQQYQQNEQNNEKQKQNKQKQLLRNKQQIQILQKQIIDSKKLIQQQKIKSTNLQNKIKQMLNEKKNIKQDDDQFFNELQQEVENSYKQISKLKELNNQLTEKIREVLERNTQLQTDLQSYAQTFEKQSITFRNALQNLQKQKDYREVQNKKISQQLKSLKLEYQQSRTAQSFYEYENNSSLQLRKTVSTDLDSHLRKSIKKIERKTLSSLDKQKSSKINKLKSVLEQLKYQLPVVCQIDATGYLKDQRTGCYFTDENQNYFYLDAKELESAVKLGLILL